MNVAKNLENAAFYFPKRTAVIENDQEINFLEFNRLSNRVATALLSVGIRLGEHVALYAPNAYQWLAFYFGVLKAGAVAVTLSSLLKRDELRRIMDNAQPKVLFAGKEQLAELGDRKYYPYLKKILSEGGDVRYEGLVEMGSDSFGAIDLDRHNTAAILYTGGTTGIPKGVMLSHENLNTSIHNVAHYERSTHKDRALCFLPLNHVFGQIHIMNATVYSGGSLVLESSFDLEKVIETIERHKVTKFFAVPTVYIRLLALKDLKEKMGSLRYTFSAAASMAAELVREWKRRMDLDIYEAYGMTESASMVTYNHYYRHVIGSVGTPVTNVEVQIRDLEGNVLGTKEEGEICIRGRNIMKGYLNQPEETRSVFWDNWFRSGDIGTMDEDGYLYIVDRLKDMIITGGENVYPREVEEVLYTRPEVEECTVIGLPDKEYGERVTAFIIPKEGQQVDPTQLKSYLKTKLSPFKVPKEFIAVDELPKSSAGKILKRELKQKVLADKPENPQ
ncbi:MAG: long-chain-fatty-acid--CoA ligase [Deltaproteobacteria bacterium]|nr:MAG: long-chain-fatty-acid--CoA ligase [Deltaproteobacteria bacterium]